MRCVLDNRAYYTLTSDESIDNPDQRIADDINAFSAKSLRFLLELTGDGGFAVYPIGGADSSRSNRRKVARAG